MKTIILGLALLASMSSFAIENCSRDTRMVSQRTGDFISGYTTTTMENVVEGSCDMFDMEGSSAIDCKRYVEKSGYDCYQIEQVDIEQSDITTQFLFNGKKHHSIRACFACLN